MTSHCLIPVMASLLIHICVTWPQWVNCWEHNLLHTMWDIWSELPHAIGIVQPIVIRGHCWAEGQTWNHAGSSQGQHHIYYQVFVSYQSLLFCIYHLWVCVKDPGPHCKHIGVNHLLLWLINPHLDRWIILGRIYQYQGCWWPGVLCHLVFSSHGIDFVN